MSDIKKFEDSLFSEWIAHAESSPEFSSSRGTFVKDGMVDKDTYQAAPKTILFLLKEVNDEGGGGWDLRDNLRDYKSFARNATWLNIARWVKGLNALFKPDKELNWHDDLEKIDIEEREKLFSGIVAMNLKKFPGGHTADTKNFWAHIERDKDFIERQIQLYSPKITICCGSIVGDAIEQVFGDEIVWEQTPRGVWYSSFMDGYLIYFAHPEARVQDSFLHYALMDAVSHVFLQTQHD